MIQTLFGSVEQEPSLLTRAGLVSALEDALQGKKEIDAELLDELESTLIAATTIVLRKASPESLNAGFETISREPISIHPAQSKWK